MKSKDIISNSLLPDSTTSSNETLKRLYVVTGKGGVGKTAFALSLTNYLKNTLQKEVLYNSFDQGLSPKILTDLKLDEFSLNSQTSLETYMGQKLGNQLVAKWIMKTPFFASLYQMIPGLGHMIMLGHIINKLKENPNLIIVLDSPSSGHALTMFESTHNFREIFGSGPLFRDIEKMHEFLYGKNIIKTFVIGLPTSMAINEGLEIIHFLDNLKLNDHSFIINDSYKLVVESLIAENDSLPDFLNKKIGIEKEVFSNTKFDFILPHELGNNSLEVVSSMTKKINGIRL